jgi:hypothetical protein
MNSGSTKKEGIAAISIILSVCGAGAVGEFPAELLKAACIPMCVIMKPANTQNAAATRHTIPDHLSQREATDFFAGDSLTFM